MAINYSAPAHASSVAVAGIDDAGRPGSPIPVTVSLFSGALSQELCDVEVYKIGVMKDNRFDRALDLVPLVTMRGDDVQHFAGNSVLVRERDAAERMPHLLPKLALDHIA